MAGVLVLAAGVPAAFQGGDFTAIEVGYPIMRIGLGAQWVRVAIEDPVGRPTAIRYGIGTSLTQLGWILWVLLLGGSPWWFLPPCCCPQLPWDSH